MVKFLDEAGLIRYTEKLKNLLAGKQDKLKGTEGQVVGFDAAGKAVPQGTESLRGPAGKDGTNGTDGRSAYQYAVDGGYTGTEEQFKALMGTGPWLPVAGGIMTGALDMGLAGIEGAKFFGFGFSADTIRPTNGYPLFHATGSYSVKFEGRGGSIVTLQNIKNPVSDTDAANKKYVDDLIAGLEARIAALEAK